MSDKLTPAQKKLLKALPATRTDIRLNHSHRVIDVLISKGMIKSDIKENVVTIVLTEKGEQALALQEPKPLSSAPRVINQDVLSAEVDQWIKRIDAMREKPPVVGEYLLFYRNSAETPLVVYVEHVYEDREQIHGRQLGERVMNNIDYRYLERPATSESTFGAIAHGSGASFSYVPANQDHRVLKQRRFFEFRDGRCYTNTHDTLEELKVFQLMLSEFIILQEKWIEQKKREVPNVSPATAAYLAKHPTARLIEEGYINAILPPQED